MKQHRDEEMKGVRGRSENVSSQICREQSIVGGWGGLQKTVSVMLEVEIEILSSETEKANISGCKIEYVFFPTEYGSEHLLKKKRSRV